MRRRLAASPRPCTASASAAAIAAHGVRVMRVGLLYPMDPSDLRELADGVDEVLVVEEKRPFVERFLKEALFDAPVRPRVLGKTDEQGRPLVPAHGALSVDDLVPLLAARIGVEPEMFARPTHRPPRRSITVAQAAGLAALVEPDQ